MAAFPTWAVLPAATLACAGLTAAWIRLAHAARIHDAPGQRRLHAEPTPRGGGIAIAIVLLAGLAWQAMQAGQGGAGTGALPWLALAIGIGAFTLVGLVDDLRPLPVLPKFAGQWIGAAVLALGLMTAVPGVQHWLLYAALVVAAVYTVNIWNFMDGSNGLVAVQSLLVAMGVATWPGMPSELRFPAWILACACLGFLPFNLPTARVFLGDAGSHLLGAGVFVLLVLAWRSGAMPLPAALLLASAMFLDSGLTLFRRALARRPVWRAHREHLYQYAVRSGHSHLRVCLAYAAWTLVMLALARAVNGFRSTLVIWIVFILCSGLGIVLTAVLRRRWLQPGMRRGVGHE
jgi:UDP-N-acetylmuramyl pentapeptide phosphotransferase/UDP-N-acetylglucosamine-1-phosphate transferase